VDKSGYDKRSGFGQIGWSPLSVTPVQIFQFEKRYQTLPVYTQDGIILTRVFLGSTDSTAFEDFVEQLLLLCGRWPEPKSVLVMDNATIHHTEHDNSDIGIENTKSPLIAKRQRPILEHPRFRITKLRRAAGKISIIAIPTS
jgi:hypothetical protein